MSDPHLTEKTHKRSNARLGAVQALYQMDLAQTDLTDVIEEFISHRLIEDLDDQELGKSDISFFKELVYGIVDKQRELDPEINQHLAKGWRLNRIDSTLRAILRAGAYELSERRDLSTPIIINEYVDVAHAFFETDEPKVVNAVLEKIAQHIRS